MPEDLFNKIVHGIWLTIGNTEITLFRIIGLLVILFIVWWVAKTIERVLTKLSQTSNYQSLSPSAIYAISRISRYIVWLLGLVIGLNFIGFDLSSLALLGAR